MKKFTKICLAIALATFLIGCLLGCVGMMLGGPRQLEHVNVKQLTGIPFRFARNGDGTFFGFWDDDWEEYWDWDSSEWNSVEELGSPENTGEAGKDNRDPQSLAGSENEDVQTDGDAGGVSGGMETGLTAARLRKLEIEVGACQMYIGEASGDELSIAVTGECEDHYRYRIKEGDTFMLVHKDMKSGDFDDLWKRNHHKGNTKIKLYLPKNASLDEVSIDFGAGKLESGYLKAREIEISVGAGECVFEGLEASESADISLGAGKFITESLVAREAGFDIAAGELQVNGAKVGSETQVDISMGNAVLNGVFAGELDVECSMGSLELTLEGAESDYNYEVDCGMGSIKIGGNDYDGLADHEIYNGSNDIIDISCSMGTVNVNFTR